MSDKKMKIGILLTGHITGELGEKHGTYADMFMDLLGSEDFEYETFVVADGTLPDNVEQADGWIITGSKHGVYEDIEWIPRLEQFIRDLHASGKPTIGICFGHQAIAQALGGKVEKYHGGWGVGHQTYKDVKNDRDVTLLAFHQDQVIIPPEGAKVTHTSDFCANAGLEYSDNMMSLQPHPEHGHEFSEDLLEERRGHIVPDEVADAAIARMSDTHHHIEYAAELKEYFLSRQ
ncbi:type 1 glutamine amidotransferase [Sneathiella sp. P13V-1]|uniref:type 1 glutamine amidotransferase n=1 Tax=Sneathiella sp. P13V-1 TaxID=2697366 RepID=UPI00187BB566|nr:type 1 glutamine amidotransferase [Sneathiella sp. P13V-1]MBE7638558.1 type 1 glutamine amidotransferase [Sneathiella sp. P13V-1]